MKIIHKLIMSDYENNEGEDYENPLLTATSEGDEEKVKQLLAMNIYNIDEGDEDGSTPLINACAGDYRSAKIAELLIKAGANVNIQDCNGNTPLIFVAENGMINIARLLISHKADVNHINNDCESAILVAHNNENCETVRLLYKNGAYDDIINEYDEKFFE